MREDKQSELLEISVIFVKQTAKAILVSEGKEERWIPKSLVEGIDDFEELKRGQDITCNIPEWFAEKEGFC